MKSAFANVGGGAVDPSKSSTYEELSPDKYGGFNISYQDQTNVTGLMIMESVTIDGMTLHNQTTGLATNSTETRGILGLGLDAGESTVSGTDVPPYTYPTVIDNLVKQGIISKPVFSMYLNSLTNPHGNLLFGGVDTSKFYDELVTMPLIPFAGEVNITGYSVQLENFTALGLDTVQGGKLEALLDSGTSQTLIPQAWLDPITQHLGVEQDPRSDDGTTWVDCAMAQKHGNIKLVFQFVGKAIYVPMSTMVWRQTLSDADKNGIRNAIPDSKNWSDICTFGLAASDGPLGTGAGTGILGDTFMRNAYVVHDLENLKVGLAQASTNSTGEDIVNVPDQGGIPAATGSPIPASVTQGNDNPLPTDPIPPQSTSGSGNESSAASSAVGSSRAIVVSFVAAFIVHVFIL